MNQDNQITQALELQVLSRCCKADRLSTLEKLLDSRFIDRKVVEILLSIENVPSTITEYRDKERHLESLLKCLREEKYHQCKVTQTISVRYLLGSLYINFEKFWGPTIRVIFDLLNQSRFQTTLLDLINQHLKETNDIIYSEVSIIESLEDRPDHVLHRNFILQILSRFTHYVQSNNELFMEQFFKFVEKELHVSPFIERYTRDNLTVKKGHELEDDTSSKLDNEEKRPTKYTRKSKVPTLILQKRKSRETFLTASKILQSFTDLSKIHRQNELKELILDLLCCRDCSVQKAAFNCLLAFDNTVLGQYSDRVLRIINDKMIKTELTMFSLDESETNQIQETHREHLMPVLLRVLFGKMVGKVGKNSSGRDKADLRKALVMRFVASCSVNEILSFFEHLFNPLYTFVDVPYSNIDKSLSKHLDITQYVPLNKLHAMLSSLSSFIESVGNLKQECLSKVLKLINIITFYTIKPLQDSKICNQLNSRNVELLKGLRRECINITSYFFRMFEYYQYSQDEINSIFSQLVWPSTTGFIDRNYCQSTPLLKLIETFASNRIYHKLLVKRNKYDKDEYLLRHVIELYSDPKTKRDILKNIASILADIIDQDRNEVDDGEDELVELPIVLDDPESIIPPYDKNLYKVSQDLSYGQKMLISSIPAIFERLKQNCIDFLVKKDSDYKIENDELFVLSGLANHLKDPEQSLLGARLLLSTLAHQKKRDLILNTLKTVQLLIKQAGTFMDPNIISLIADILYHQPNSEQRKELCTVITLVSEKDQNLVPVARVIELMNTTSAELIENPDLVKWNEGFQEAFEYIDGLNELQINNPIVVQNSITLLLHQTGFIINNVDRYEFSIRENCLIFFEKLAQKISLIDSEKNSQLINQLVEETILNKFIRKGMKETNETIKHTYLGILRVFALHCHEKNKILNEMYLFCDTNKDIDFWHNIRHIQLHNRSKALARLIVNEKLKDVSPKTLSAYFMPIATGFLFSKAYKTVATLAENSIKLIGFICKRLNWVTYESTLSYYLELLTKSNSTYQKTNIKLITEILKNFNFDISACKEALENEEENAKLEKRMKKRRGPSCEYDGKEAIATDAPSGKRLNPSTARMVYFSVTKKLLPRLNSCLHEMTRVEFEHDKNMSDYLPEKEEIKRIPIAFAIVQLLNLLPGRYVLFRDQLPILFLKLSSFLKSKNETVRKAARHTLIKVMSFIGPAYMSDLLRVLKQNLDKGFQIHVLNYTVHSVLDKMPLHYGSLDICVQELVNSCFQEIFGRLAEDKDIAQILAKTFEAKKTKSYDTLLILSSYISVEKLDYLMKSIKEVLKTSTEPKKVNKLSICIQKVFNGLAKNDHFPLDKLLEFIQVSIEESIPSLRIRQKVESVSSENCDMKQKVPLREDRFLISKDPPRDRVKSKINEKGNSHMIVENCLRLLLHTFEKNRIIIKRKEAHKKKLDGLIQLLSTCLKSSSPKCVMRALKCIYFIAQAKADLPTFKTKCNSIVKKIFILLNLYNGVGMVQGDNLEMISTCFKTVTLLLLHCEDIQLDPNQVRSLLTYIEQDLYDSNRQATAFATLHSLLQKRYDSPELIHIMVRVSDLLVTSEDEAVRSMSAKMWQTYLIDYKHETKVFQSHVAKFLRQLDYEFIDGRRSVVKMLYTIISKFPETLLRENFEIMFHLLSQRIVNEESKEVRDLVAQLIALLIQRLPDQQKFLLEKFVFNWSTSTTIELKLLGVKLVSIFVEACKSLFDKDKVKKALAIIIQALPSDEKSLKTSTDENDTEDSKLEEMRLVLDEDRLVYHSLRLFRRLLSNELITCVEKRYIDQLKKIWQYTASEGLSHWHLPVVLTASELYIVFIKKTTLNKSLQIENPLTDDYLDWNAQRIVRLLCDKFINLLDRSTESEQLLNYTTESLILLGQLVAKSHSTYTFEKNYSSSFENNDILDHLLSLRDLPNDGFLHDKIPGKITDLKKQTNFMWLSVKIVNQARKESARFRLTECHRREFVLKWTAAMAQVLGFKRISIYIILFMMTPVRELTDKGKSKSDSTLTLSEDLLKFFKGLIGVETFNKIYSKVQLHYTRRRVERKKKEAVIKVRDQTRGVKRKIKHNKIKDKKRRLKR